MFGTVAGWIKRRQNSRGKSIGCYLLERAKCSLVSNYSMRQAAFSGIMGLYFRKIKVKFAVQQWPGYTSLHQRKVIEKDTGSKMPSLSLVKWNTVRVPAFDEIENAHRLVGGTKRGRRYATQQINHAYAVLLSSQFQGYCRDLHSESVDALVNGITPAALKAALRVSLVLDRKLDRGNPNPGNIGADFNRLGVKFWNDVKSLDRRNADRMGSLEELNQWRNAIAHQDFDPIKLGGTTVLVLADVRVWRRVCISLAPAFDVVMADYIGTMGGLRPW